MIDNRDCEACGLREQCNGPVPDDGGDYSILVVGEAPGEDEDKQGRPFIGPSGQVLRDTMSAVGFPMDKVTFTNIVRCRPPDNKMKAKYIKACYTSLPVRDNTRLIILLGNTPLKAVLGESGITSWSGNIIEHDGIMYMPLLHPAYFLHKGGTQSEEFDDWILAMHNGSEAYIHGLDIQSVDDRYEYLYPDSSKAIYDMCKELLASEVIAFDTEVARLDAFAEDNLILALSFANDKRAWAVAIDHPDVKVPLPDADLDMICNVLEAHDHIVCHNAKFDQMQVSAMLGCDFYVAGDTMLASFLVESKAGIHSLKHQAAQRLNMYGYDAEVEWWKSNYPKRCDPVVGGTYANIPLRVLLPYSARDAAVTYALNEILLPELTPGQRVLYDQITIPVSNTLARMQYNGMAVDNYVAERYRRIYTQKRRGLRREIRDDRMVLRYERDRKAGKVDKRGKVSDKFRFNPNSSQQKADVLYGKHYYGLEPLGTTESGEPSVKRDYLEPYRDRCSLVNDLIMYVIYTKMLGTYIEPVATGSKLSGDGKARSSFNQHIVETGRLSSSGFSRTLGFNQQNIPTPEKEPGTLLASLPIKNLFTHTHPGGCLLSVDYSGMELRVFASLAKCQAMIDIHRSGRDFHTMVGAMVSGKDYEDITKEERYRYKWTNWTLLYGGDEYTLNRLYQIPLLEAKLIIKRYYDRFPEVPLYLKRCAEFAARHGYIDTPFGNRRALPDIHSPVRWKREKAEREAVNTPVQGAAGIITLMALIIVDEEMYSHGYQSMLVNTVHDSILTDVYPGELDNVAELQVTVMENLHEYATLYMPDINLDWLTCPLKADVEVGSHYGSMSHYGIGEAS